MYPTLFLVDVDNTLVDNDAIRGDLSDHLIRACGAEREARYWTILEELRAELGYVDYLGALQRFRLAYPHDVHLLEISAYLAGYPFADRLYPQSLAVIDRLSTLGQVVLLTDGDIVFQPQKVRRSGLWSAVGGEVLVYVHKEQELDDVERRYPAEHYVVIDDKLRILTAIKAAWGDRVTTVFPRQGQYANDPAILRSCPPADVEVSRIGDLLAMPAETLLPVELEVR